MASTIVSAVKSAVSTVTLGAAITWNSFGSTMAAGIDNYSKSNNKYVRKAAKTVSTAADDFGGNWGSALVAGMVFSTVVIGGAALLGAGITAGAGAIASVYNAVTATNIATTSAEVGGSGYGSFQAAKNAMGSPGNGMVWHHIVEQCQGAKTGFDSFLINNTSNLIAVNNKIHVAISGYYNTTSFGFTNGLSVRNWLAGQSYQAQYKFGIQIL